MSGGREYISQKIDEAGHGFTASANLFKEARENNNGPDILAEARNTFERIMALASVLKTNHTEALDALNSGISHTQTAFNAMQDTGDFTQAGDDTSMMNYAQRALREADEAKQKIEASLLRYDDKLSPSVWSDHIRFLGEHKDSLERAARFMDDTIDGYDKTLTALADYKTQI